MKTVRHRLDVYHKQTKPLVGFYQALADGDGPDYRAVEGAGSVDDIRDKVYVALES